MIRMTHLLNEFSNTFVLEVDGSKLRVTIGFWNILHIFFIRHWSINGDKKLVDLI